MSTSYNKFGGKSRVGNWVEEEALQAATGTSRYTTWVDLDDPKPKPITLSSGVDKGTDTNSRVMYHSDHADFKSLKSTMRDSHDPERHSAVLASTSTDGPRAARLRKALEEEATRVVEPSEKKYEWETTAKATFTQHTDEAYTEPKGRRVMKTLDGKDLPPGCRDEDFLATNGISARTPKLTAEEAAGMLPRGDYMGQMPVSIYTQRLAEGSFPASAATGANPFSKSTAFTAPITDATRHHAEAIDDISGEPIGSKSCMAVAAGAELSAEQVADQVRAKLRERGGSNSIRSLNLMLKRMDASGDGAIDPRELQDGLADMGIILAPKELMQVFHLFDRDRSGKITVREFQRALAGKMPERRLELVREAFRRLDKTGDGVVTLADLAEAYDASKNPEVAAGTLSADACMEQMLANFDVTEADGIVTAAEFQEYYADLSAGIDDDDYFELMMRNAWHISGGEGWAENTSNLRVLVIHLDGTQEVVEVKDDLGLTAGDIPAIKARLRKQGVKNIHSVKLNA